MSDAHPRNSLPPTWPNMIQDAGRPSAAPIGQAQGWGYPIPYYSLRPSYMSAIHSNNMTHHSPPPNTTYASALFNQSCRSAGGSNHYQVHGAACPSSNVVPPMQDQIRAANGADLSATGCPSYDFTGTGTPPDTTSPPQSEDTGEHAYCAESAFQPEHDPLVPAQYPTAHEVTLVGQQVQGNVQEDPHVQSYSGNQAYNARSAFYSTAQLDNDPKVLTQCPTVHGANSIGQVQNNAMEDPRVQPHTDDHMYSAHTTFQFTAQVQANRASPTKKVQSDAMEDLRGQSDAGDHMHYAQSVHPCDRGRGKSGSGVEKTSYATFQYERAILETQPLKLDGDSDNEDTDGEDTDGENISPQADAGSCTSASPVDAGRCLPSETESTSSHVASPGSITTASTPTPVNSPQKASASRNFEFVIVSESDITGPSNRKRRATSENKSKARRGKRKRDDDADKQGDLDGDGPTDHPGTRPTKKIKKKIVIGDFVCVVCKILDDFRKDDTYSRKDTLKRHYDLHPSFKELMKDGPTKFYRILRPRTADQQQNEDLTRLIEFCICDQAEKRKKGAVIHPNDDVARLYPELAAKLKL